jgi:hypothetical protein
VETQKYWILAVNAALIAQNRKRARGARAKRIWGKVNAKILNRKKLGMVAIEQQIRKDGMHQSPNPNDTTSHHTQASIETFVQKRPHSSATQSQLKSNKRMRKPD